MNDPQLNRQLGPYRLLRVVGRGGMGTVYAATDQDSGDEVAVKVLSPALASEASFRERFSSEIESLKRLLHPNIVQLYGYGEQDGQLFYSMELIHGHSLQHELKLGRRFTWRDVTTIAIDVCGALKHAHDHGIIHRDLKPANLLCTPPNDQIRLLDFGIAKLFGNTGVTTGNIMGTADYMAPEQAEGKAVGPRTDLYSLGSVMYALLAGRPPFVGKSMPEVVHKVRFESPVPVGRLAADVPVELDNLIEQLLNKDPQERIPTALATAHRLKALEHALSVHLEPTETPELATPASNAPPASATPRDPDEQQTIRLDSDLASEDRVKQLTVTTRESDEDNGSDHFTSVSGERDVEPPNRFHWQTMMLAVLLTATIWMGYEAVRRARKPASADQLYASIINQSDPSNPSSLVNVERKMSDFLAGHPDDRRIEEVSHLKAELELYRLQRRLREEARRRQRTPSPLPMEEIYLDILPLVESDPANASEQLQAMLDVYDHPGMLDDDERPYLVLARRQLERLRSLMAEQASSRLPLLNRQLIMASDLVETDPDRAGRIFAGIIRLYEDTPWASDAVQTARVGMQELANRRSSRAKDEIKISSP